MEMQAFLRPLKELEEFEQVMQERCRESGMIQIAGCTDSQKAHMVYAAGDGLKYKIIALSDEVKARQFYEDYRFFEPGVMYYPSRDLLFYHADVQGKMLESARMEVVKALFSGDPVTVVLCMDGFMDMLPHPKLLQRSVYTIREDSTVDLAEAEAYLAEHGYERETQAMLPGQFAVRGGILDIYPMTEEQPVRIELWGDEVDSIRSFDPESQRSIERLKEVTVYPAAEPAGREIVKVSFLEYFDPKETLLFLDEPVRLVEKGRAVEQEFLHSMANRVEKGMEVDEEELQIYRTEEVTERMNEYCCIGLSTLETRCREFKIRRTFSIQTKNVNSYQNSFDILTKDLKRVKRNGYRVILLSGSRSRAKRLAEDLRDYNLSSFYSEDLNREIQPGEILVACGHISKGYEYPMVKFLVISVSDIFGRVKKNNKRRTSYEGEKIQSFTDLKVGDYVVHENHGLGVYRGIEKIEVDKVAKDYMKIEYAKGGNLYIPATQLDMIQKYAGADAKRPKLNTLGTQEWNRTKTRVKGAVKEIARDLVELYAARQEKQGFVYGPDTVWQKEFEEMFPFEETEDQIMAIEAMKKDMESTRIMDRLICGDVGYGKTEIAIRAAFKAVQENKQVVYLVPTTVLAQQHYNTFVQRMKDFPVRVDLMCRFRTAAQQRKTIEDAKKGLVDIIIGTHRVLSKDVEFKDLGLLIIDEEQRFGVQHKERIKQMKENVDVLTLTATPIPRTLHMSLIGIRDMSVLEEPPMDRLPIQTYVMEYNDEMVREAIERELSREGQVFYVYNRVEDIAQIAADVQKLVPDAVVAYAHGQMREHKLERIMCDFINGDIDVLVSTTIIETGLDISNANTIIIHDSDRLGLSQLYQLRGRVGRSNRMAYAFLLYRRDKLLRETAEKRLSAIREFTDLGSGFKIAMKDLEIRGAGNLLGAEQHGHMDAIGYDLYCKLLNEAVKQLKGQAPEESFHTTLDLNIDAYIPESYIPNEYQKLDIYKRIANIESEEEQEDVTEELLDRFGDIPRKVQLLLDAAAIRVLAHSADVTSVEQKGDEYRIVMYERARVNPQKIQGLLDRYHGDLQFKADAIPYFIYQKKSVNRKKAAVSPLDLMKKVLTDIKALIDE
jgi:transcription-repair coupling factor (superfamily II helicase)